MMKTFQSTTIYLGNTRTVSNDSLLEYCSKFGLILDCSRRLKTADQIDLVDFTFLRFLNAQSVTKFLSISSHTLNNGIILDVRPFDDILHTAVPLHVDRKILIRNLSNEISLSEVKKYLRTFGTIQNINMDMNEQEERRIFVEFESAAARNKLLKGKIKYHRIRDRVLNILPFLRPTDVDLYQAEDKQQPNSNDDGSLLIHLEREYNLKIREQFHFIENHISEYLREKRDNYEQIAQRLK